MPELFFDTNKAPETRDFSVIPEGNYVGRIVATEMKATKAGTGRYLQLEIEFEEGAAAGRKLWDRLNIENPNEMAVEIAQRTLANICRALGITTLRNTEELHGKPLQVSVRVRPAGPDRSGTYRDETNEIKGYRKAPDWRDMAPASARPAPAQAPAAGTAQAQAEAQMMAAAAGAPKKPWRQ